MAGQAPGGVATLTADTIGYEWDEDLDNGVRPAGLVRMSSTTVDGVQKLQDYGSTYAPGKATHGLTLYRDTNGAGKDALVFGAGTIQWPWGLDGDHDRGGSVPSAAMQQATVNVLADMDAEPTSLQPGLAAPTASIDAAPPTSAITSPAAGATVEQRLPVTIRGTAADSGGRVGAVEVSVDDGASWHPASGREAWSYTWTPGRVGAVTLRSRAADDSGNLETAPGPLPAPGGAGSVRGAADRGRRAVPGRRGWRRHGPALLQGRHVDGDARGAPLERGRHATRDGGLLRGVRFRLAAGHALTAGPRGRRRDLRRLLRLQRQLLCVRRQLLHGALRRRAAARPGRRERRLPLRRRLSDRDLRGDQLLGGRRLRAHRSTVPRCGARGRSGPTAGRGGRARDRRSRRAARPSELAHDAGVAPGHRPATRRLPAQRAALPRDAAAAAPGSPDRPPHPHGARRPGTDVRARAQPRRAARARPQALAARHGARRGA